MQGVFLTLLGPVLVLWAGALVLDLADRLFEPQDRGGAEAFVLALAVASLLVARGQANVPLAFGQLLEEVEWVGTLPFLAADRTAWLSALLIVGIAWMGSLATLGQPTVGRSGRLAALGAALLFLFAGDWATLILAWALVDLALLYALAQRGRADSSGHRELGWTGALSLIGAVALGVALLLGQQAEGGAGGLASEVNTAATRSLVVGVLGVLAVLMRWMPFPLPMWQAIMERDADREHRLVVRVMLVAIPCMLGLHLWARLAQSRIVAQSGHWVLLWQICAGMGLVVAAIKAWSTQDPDQVVTSVNSYACAVLLLGAGLASRTDWMLPIGVNVVLSASALYVSWTQGQYLRVSNLRTYWRIVPALVALLSLAGLPLTIGFAAHAGLYKTMFAGGRWLALIVLIAGEALVLGALLRVVFEIERVDQEEGEVLEEGQLTGAAAVALGSPETEKDREPDGAPVAQDVATVSDSGPMHWMREVHYGAGAALALAIVVLGFAPGLLSVPGLGFWLGLLNVPILAALLLPIVGAFALYRSQSAEKRMQVFSATIVGWGPLVRRLLGLDWLYRLVEGILQRVGSLIWATTQVVQGAGYMAWVVLVCLVILLFVLGR